MTTRYTTPSRRSALQLFGASAALATSGAGFAAHAASTDPKGVDFLLTLNDVPLAWPQYHRLASFETLPQVYTTVFLERDVPHPSGHRGIAVSLPSGEQLGYVANQHHAALDWALQRGGSVDARLSAINEPVVRGRRIPGWGAFHISVAVQAPVAAV